MIVFGLCALGYLLVACGVSCYAVGRLHKSSFRASMVGLIWLPMLMIAIGIKLCAFMSDQIGELHDDS